MVITDNPVQLELQTDSANSDMDRWDPATPEPEKQVRKPSADQEKKTTIL